MNDELSSYPVSPTVAYIEIPCSPHRPEKIDTILKRRMYEFMLRRRQKQWLERGD